MKGIIAIDPGISGGMAWIDADGRVDAETMPDGMTQQADRLRSLSIELSTPTVVIEKTGTARPTDAKTAAVKFARHVGNLEAIIYTLGMPSVAVAPVVWQRALGKLPKEKRDRKRAIRELMARRHPAISVTLKTADALGILCWAMEQNPTRRCD